MRRLVVPEIVQLSAMDCGPAVLTAFARGHGLGVGYETMRELCRTQVDGTSIDDLEDVLTGLGLAVEQVMTPLDHLPLAASRAVPGILVVRLAGGLPHFVVLWRRHARWLQVMDPAAGRSLAPADQVLGRAFVHSMSLPAPAVEAYLGGAEYRAGLAARLARLGVDASPPAGLRELTVFDAAVRAGQALADAGALPRGESAGRFVAAARADPEGIPDGAFAFRLSDDDTVRVRGALLLRPRLDSDAARAGDLEMAPTTAPMRRAPAERPRRRWPLLRLIGRRAIALGAMATALGVLGTFAEALFFRALLGVGSMDHGPLAWAMLASPIAGVVLAGALAAAAGLAVVLRSGRQVDVSLRRLLLWSFPRVPAAFLVTRPPADLVQRGHDASLVRGAPGALAGVLAAAGGLLATIGGLLYLDPAGAPAVLAVAVVALLLPVLLRPWVVEGELLVRTHLGAISTSLLDALRGATPVRAHDAGPTFARVFQQRLVDWVGAAARLVGVRLRAEALVGGVAVLSAAGLLYGFVTRNGGAVGDALLVVYWTFSLPYLARALSNAVLELSPLEAAFARAAEPSEAVAPSDAADQSPATPPDESGRARAGVAIELRGVSVRAGGTSLLEALDLRVEPGAFVALVGPSGAGKTTVVRVILGLEERMVAGSVSVDGRLRHDVGRAADAARTDPDGPEPSPSSAGSNDDQLRALRRDTAWVDGALHLSRGSLADNVRYGAVEPVDLERVVGDAELEELANRLGDGLADPVGEGGRLLAGGEAQRVRLGRAFARSAARLVILDEAFRGLPRADRRRLLERVRSRFEGATILLITHDVSDTEVCDSVVVMSDGRAVERGRPDALLSQGSLYARLHADDAALARSGGAFDGMRRVEIADRRLREASA